jgi:predicted AAA+ superfamily ATPase
MHLCPFVRAEVADFDLARALSFGMLPPIYTSDEPAADLASYVGEYLQEEIRAEALARNIESFSRFLRQAALSHAQVLNFESVARDAQVPARTIREYYAVLEDTLIGTLLEPLQTRGRRKPSAKAKFYFFDIGVVHALIGQHQPADGTDAWGRAFETFIFMELCAHASYNGGENEMAFWRTVDHEEVDFVWRGEVAIEVKASRRIHSGDLKGLAALHDSQPMRRRICVCREPERRTLGAIEVVPYGEFLDELWGGSL